MKERHTAENLTVTLQGTHSRKNRQIYYVLAILGIYGGILAIGVGFGAAIVHSFIPGDAIFDRLGTVLMILGIPLMIMGGHFLDTAISKIKN